jgi:hypothetical protein
MDRTTVRPRPLGTRYLDVMIHAYFDDSGDSLGADFAVCGGIFGNAEDSVRLNNQWRQATKLLKQPFRSTDCECQHGQFGTWSKAACDDLMAKLVGVLSNPDLRSNVIATSVPCQFYREVFPTADRNDPFRLALRHLLIGMARIARKKQDRVRCWFEKGSNNGAILSAYKDVSEYPFTVYTLRGRLAGLELGTKRIPQLQAADLIAREGFKAGANFGDRPFRKPLVRLWDHAGVVIWSKDSLVKLRDSGNPLSMDALDKLPDNAFMMDVTTTPFSESRKPI